MNFDKIDKKIGIIGGGNMAQAICEGMIRKGLYDYSGLHVSAVSDKTLDFWKKLGAKVTKNNLDIILENDIIFLAVKPHIFKPAIEKIRIHLNSIITKKKLFISIIAGITLETLEQSINDWCNNAIIVRTMPNTPMMVGEGCTAYCGKENFFYDNPNFVEIVENILKSCGKCFRIDENLMNGFGALAGSGPAFIYLMIEAMSDGGVKMGLPRQLSMELASQTVLGAAKMVQETKKHPGQLKDEVCSPGGTTITGIHELEKAGVRNGFISAIEAAAKKSKELGETHKNK